MDDKTLTALRASIVHWAENVAAKTAAKISLGGNDCALCNMFAQRDASGTLCLKCPVYGHTLHLMCENTPYNSAFFALGKWQRKEYDNAEFVTHAFDLARTEWRLAAQAELDFLKSLLPEGE